MKLTFKILIKIFVKNLKSITFAHALQNASYTVVVAQLVRALVCGTKGRRFESGLPPKK